MPSVRGMSLGPGVNPWTEGGTPPVRGMSLGPGVNPWTGRDAPGPGDVAWSGREPLDRAGRPRSGGCRLVRA